MTKKTTEEMTRRTVDKILNNTKMAEAERAGMFQDKDRDDVSTDRAETILSEKTPGVSFTIDSDEATDRGSILLNGEKYEVGCSGGIKELKLVIRLLKIQYQMLILIKSFTSKGSFGASTFLLLLTLIDEKSSSVTFLNILKKF